MAVDKSKYPHPMPILIMVFWTGLVGGLLWALFGYLAYTFKFTEIPPYVILEPLALGSLKHQWSGTIMTFILYGVFSLIAAFFYYAVLKGFSSIWIGLGYGFVLFLLIFLVLNPLMPGMKSFVNLQRDTIITSICIYILYGMFIGYSISYEYQLKKIQKEEPVS